MHKTAPKRTTLCRIDVHAYRVPVKCPVQTSFGVMTNRPAVFIRLEEEDGCFGWGEVFANWPAAGAEHRARLLVEDLGDLVLGATIKRPSDLFYKLDAATQIRALQCGEPGSFAQVIAGLDQALHDLFARWAGVPLHSYLSGVSQSHVPAYASGVHISDGFAICETLR